MGLRAEAIAGRKAPLLAVRLGWVSPSDPEDELADDRLHLILRRSAPSSRRAQQLHYGTATEVRAQRAATLDAAYAANPARFRHRRPEPPKLPTVAWINDPTPEALIKSA